MDRQRQRREEVRRFAFRVWFSLISLLFVGAFTVAMILWLRSQSNRADFAGTLAMDDVASGALAREVEIFTPPSEREAVRILRSALEARDVDIIHQYVHETSEVDVEEMLGFFAAIPEREGEALPFEWTGTTESDRLQIQGLNVYFEKDFLRSARMAMLLPDEDGEWKLDFPSFARWSDPPLDLFDSGDGYPGGRVRVILAQDQYFNGPFADDREWACYAVYSPDIDTTAFVYSRIGSPENRQVRALLEREGGMVRANVEIRRTDGALRNQFELTRVIAGDWLAVEWRDQSADE